MRRLPKIRRGIFLAIVSLIGASCAPGEEAPPPTAEPTPIDLPTITLLPTDAPLPVEETLNVPYAGTRPLDIFAPAEPGPWPVVVLLHGGDGGSPVALWTLGSALAGQGAVVFIPSYHASKPPLDSITDGWEEAACAIRFARARAADYGGDPSWVVVGGHSAGGTAGAVMMLAGDDFVDDDCLVQEGTAVPDAFVGIDGAYDILHFIPEDELAQAPGEWALLSPYTYLDSRPIPPDYPIYLIVSEEDELIGMGREFQAALTAAGHDVPLVIAPSYGHNSIVGDPAPEVVQIIMAFARLTSRLCVNMHHKP
jgi:acetyl esterase/lipase